MNRLPISVCMISGAEAARIGRGLESVASWVSEIVVVLNQEVDDGTEEIAKRHGAKVFREPWKGYIAQVNSALEKATQTWCLGLDADEVISPELRDEIIALLDQPEVARRCAAYSMPRLTEFCGRWIRHGDWYPDRCLRLWQRGRARWGGAEPHYHLEVQGAKGRLRGRILHYTALSLDAQLGKIITYSNHFVRNAQASQLSVSWGHLAFRPCWRFVRAYFLRLGFLDGWQGYYIAWMTAFHTVTRYAKVRDAREHREPGDP